MLSTLAADHVYSPRNVGPLEGATHEGVAWAPWLIPGDGPYIRLWLDIDPLKSVIVRAAYAANGCPSSIACGSMAAQILVGRSIEQATSMTAQDLMVLLGGLAEGKEYCAELAITALRTALDSIGETDR